MKASNEEMKTNLGNVEEDNLDLQAKIKQQGKNFNRLFFDTMLALNQGWAGYMAN